MSLRDKHKQQREKELEEELLQKQLKRAVEYFNSQDVRTRLKAIDDWAEAAGNKPGNQRLLSLLPEVMRHLKDTNTQVLGAVLDAWKAAAKANPADRDVLAYMPAIVERLDDPDELVRYAANSALEAAAKANPGHEMIEAAKARRK
jgi:hypothetical protein